MGNAIDELESQSQVKRIAFFGVASQLGGVEFSTLYLARSLDRARWSPVVVCPDGGEFAHRCRAGGLTVLTHSAPRLYSTSVRIGKWAFVNPFAMVADLIALFSAASGLAKSFRAQSFDLIVTKGLLAHFYGGLAARRAKIPCVWHVQDRVSDRVGPLYAWTLSAAGRWLAREIIADAESIAKQMRTFIPHERVHVIWNGVDTCEFSPQSSGSRVRDEWQAGDGDLLVGAIGRLTRWKGQHLLIQAFARLASEFPNARVFFVGAALFDSEAYARELKHLARRLGLENRVIFAGFRWDMPEVFAALDIVAHTALEKDSTPLAVVSAMASGKAIVCSRVDGTAQLFEEGRDGLLFAPGNIDALTEKLELLLRDAKLRQRMGQAARAKAERVLSVEKFTLECAGIFERALEETSRRL